MPQLNPTPWFYIFISSWLILLIVVMPKILNFTFLSEPTLQTTGKGKQDPWFWPWY